MGRPRKVLTETSLSGTTTGNPLEETITNASDEVCTNCGKTLTAFVVGDGKKFCSDTCLNEYLSKK